MKAAEGYPTSTVLPLWMLLVSKYFFIQGFPVTHYKVFGNIHRALELNWQKYTPKPILLFTYKVTYIGVYIKKWGSKCIRYLWVHFYLDLGPSSIKSNGGYVYTVYRSEPFGWFLTHLCSNSESPNIRLSLPLSLSCHLAKFWNINWRRVLSILQFEHAVVWVTVESLRQFLSPHLGNAAEGQEQREQIFSLAISCEGFFPQLCFQTSIWLIWEQRKGEESHHQIMEICVINE